jgi:cysteine-S-conjugate beta-lyase
VTEPNHAGTAVATPFEGMTLERLRARTSAKWRYYPEDVLPVWVAEMDVVVAPGIVEAVQAALAEGDTGYPGGRDHAYAKALNDFAIDRWNWSFDPATAHQVTDVLTGVMETIRAVAPQGAIVLTTPVYPPFFSIAEALERPVVDAPLGPEGRIDLDALDRAFAEAATHGGRPALILSNPHNPSGVVHTREELTGVAALARKHGALVVSDEIHAPLVLPGAQFVPYLAVPGSEPDFAVLSASKGWNLAGFKAALVVPGSEAPDVSDVLHRPGNNTGHIAVIAHTAAFANARPWLDAALAGIDANRRALPGLLARHLPGARCRLPEGTYLAWVDCTDLGLGDNPAEVFLEKGRVALSGGLPFGKGGEGHVRLNLATSPEILAEAVARMGSVLGDI